MSHLCLFMLISAEQLKITKLEKKLTLGRSSTDLFKIRQPSNLKPDNR